MVKLISYLNRTLYSTTCLLHFQAASSAQVQVILDAGGVDSPIPAELLKYVDILSPNETELSRLTNMPTESFEQISQAVHKCHKMVGSSLNFTRLAN